MLLLSLTLGCGNSWASLLLGLATRLLLAWPGTQLSFALPFASKPFSLFGRLVIVDVALGEAAARQQPGCCGGREPGRLLPAALQEQECIPAVLAQPLQLKVRLLRLPSLHRCGGRQPLPAVDPAGSRLARHARPVGVRAQGDCYGTTARLKYALSRPVRRQRCSSSHDPPSSPRPFLPPPLLSPLL